MKPIWIILMVMILFNLFLLSFNAFFPYSQYSSGQYNIQNVSQNSTMNEFKNPGGAGLWGLIFQTTNISTLAVGLLGVVIATLTRNMQWIAACAVFTIINTLWIGTATVFSQIMYNYPIVGSIYTGISILVGLMSALLVLGMFGGQDQISTY